MSEAQEMSHHVQSRTLLYTENRAVTTCVIQKNVFDACVIFRGFLHLICS